MKLKTISVEKYRSITAAKRITLGRSTVLVGPNNEGKSNLLRALVIAMTVLTRGRRVLLDGRRRLVRYQQEGYNWELDFPVSLQAKNPNGQSIITIEFELTAKELAEFKTEIKSTITGTLPLRIAIGQKGVSIKFNKKGSGSAILSKKSDIIASFVSDRVDFEHIPAVRTADSAERIVSHMVSRELSVLEENDEYIKALQKVQDLQEPILHDLSVSIKDTLNKFLPKIKDVQISIDSSERHRVMRQSTQISIDDGVSTLLHYKGDGVQSLAALGLMRHYSEKRAKGNNFIIAIEEPESHLHPNAIHELKAVIDELSKKYQILITTHNPLFVDRRFIQNNIVVNNHKAKPAKTIVEIRDALGVRASDNLRHAELVLIVEGDDDRIALIALLKHYSPFLNKAFNDGVIAVDTLGGASNLGYKVSSIRDSICLHHVFLDKDRAGIDAYNKAKSRSLIDDADVNFCTYPGLKESELEDLYDNTLISTLINKKYRVSLNSPKFKTKKKWSDRVKDCFEQQGKLWNDRIESEAKWAVADAISQDPSSALKEISKDVILSLASTLESRLKEKESAQQDVAADA